MVYSENTVVFSFATFGAFAVLQSSIHDVWVRFTSSTLEDRIGYRPSDCFETFPFPENWQTRQALEAAGTAYYEFRAALMVKNDEGLTATYNRFHDPNERAPEIEKLRQLHTTMDRAVLAACGWSDINTGCKFLLDYEIDETEWGDKKRPYRYRWPDEVRDEVLARLLELNAQRAQAEVLIGSTAAKRGNKAVKAKRSKKSPDHGDLFA
jgi:hypothetical protein